MLGKARPKEDLLASSGKLIRSHEFHKASS
jgi:cobyrinic acid a,c-diamide synthase